jgi:hypothetical protein
MSFFSISTNLFYDKDILSKSNFFDEENSSIPLDNSFSLMISEENKNKNPLENIESQFQIINNSKNSEIDKDDSPAPAPLRASQSQIQNDLGVSHNMECPEVVQQDNKMADLIKLFSEEKYTEEELIEKPFDQSLYFYHQQNLENSNNGDYINNNELGDKSAAVNAITGEDSTNSLLNKVNNLDINNSNSIYNSNSNINTGFNNLEESYPAPKNNFIPTPLCSKNYKEEKKDKKYKNEKLLFLNSSKEKKNTNNTKSVIYRKLKPDSLRKKIKARFHKKLRQIINTQLKEAGSKYFFDNLPQCFITNINIGFNKPLLNITMRELFQKTFGFKAKDREKIEYNIKVLKYIEDNPDIKNNSKIDEFLDNTYKVIITKYLGGNYLLEDIERLKKEGEKDDYINRYSFIALHWVEFYENGSI